MSPWRLRQIALRINQGAIIAYPTDTIWGFGCHPLIPSAISRIQHLKRRQPNKGLILLSSTLEFCKPYIDPEVWHDQRERIATAQHKPVTWLVKAQHDCPKWLTGQYDTIAIRITKRSHIHHLCQAIKAPLVSTSANLSGHTTVRSSLLAHKNFQNSVDFIIEGFATAAQQASEIRELSTGKVLRA